MIEIDVVFDSIDVVVVVGGDGVIEDLCFYYVIVVVSGNLFFVQVFGFFS